MDRYISFSQSFLAASSLKQDWQSSQPIETRFVIRYRVNQLEGQLGGPSARNIPRHSFSFCPVRSATGAERGKQRARRQQPPPPPAQVTIQHRETQQRAAAGRSHYQPVVTMSSEAETQQQPPQPAADAESPSSPAAAASAGDKKVIGEPGNELVS